MIRIRYDWEIWSKFTKLVFFLTWEIRGLILFYEQMVFFLNLYNVVSFVEL